MVQLLKIDSNVTGLRYAEETSIGVLPGTPNWIPLEPNSYEDFGGQITTLARNPINQSRQRLKGVTVDLEASGGFQSDLTHQNLRDILQGFMFASTRVKGTEAPTAVIGASDRYSVASTTGFKPSDLVFASGFTLNANNGIKVVDAISADTYVEVAEDVADETAGADALLQVVGHRFASAELSVDVSGDLPTIVSAGVAATNDLVLTGILNLDGETVTVAGKVYTFQTVLTDVDGNVYEGTTLAEAVNNLAAAINLTGTPGTDYALSMTANSAVTAVSDGVDTVTVTAANVGVYGNDIVASETLTDGAWTDAGGFLTGGTGFGFGRIGLIPGEWVWIGGDVTNTSFATAACNGFARVFSVTDTVLTLDKTQSTMTADAGTGKTVEIYFGDVLKNESDPTLIVRRTYQIERTLGAPDTAQPTQIQGEYLVGSVPSEITLNFSTADKVTADIMFMSTDNEQVTATEGLKAGTRPDLVSEDAYNTSNDFARLKMAILDPATSNPTALFAFLTEFSVSINNNVSPNKAISVLGAFEMTAGQFTVDGSAEAYFSKIEAVQAVRNNEDVTMDFAMVKANAGIVVDIPLIALGDARLSVEQDQPILLPLELPAAADRNFNHTLLFNFFNYLPDAADPA